MMKRVFVLISLVVAILVMVGNVFAQDETSKASIPEPSLGPEWKLVSRDSDGSTTYINTRKITYLPEGIVKVLTLSVPRGEWRENGVFLLKMLLAWKGKDPNNAERLWYIVGLDKINCRTHQIANLEGHFYSFKETVLDSHSPQYEKWDRIVPGRPMESIEKYVCK